MRAIKNGNAAKVTPMRWKFHTELNGINKETNMTANTVRVLIDELVLVILNNGENTWSRAGI